METIKGSVDDLCVENEEESLENFKKRRLKYSMIAAAEWFIPVSGDKKILEATKYLDESRSGKVMIATKYFLFASLIAPYLPII